VVLCDTKRPGVLKVRGARREATRITAGMAGATLHILIVHTSAGSLLGLDLATHTRACYQAPNRHETIGSDT
jgi:hypothetical protein